MSEELKYNIGDEVWVRGTIERFDKYDKNFPHRVRFEYGTSWCSEEMMHPNIDTITDALNQRIVELEKALVAVKCLAGNKACHEADKASIIGVVNDVMNDSDNEQLESCEYEEPGNCNYCKYNDISFNEPPCSTCFDTQPDRIIAMNWTSRGTA